MTFIVEVASGPDRDELVAEIWWDEHMVAEIRQHPDGSHRIDLYPNPSRIPWSFKLLEWTNAINEAERRVRRD
jgi:hypothetical protein